MSIFDNPPPGPRVRPHRAEADKAVLSAVIHELKGGLLHLGRTRRLGRLSSRATLAGILVAGVLAGGTATAAVLLSAQRPTVFDKVRCYSEASRDFSASFPGTSVTIANAAGSASTSVDVPDQALEACAAVWRQGLLIPGASGVVRTRGIPERAVPPLAVCVLSSGEAAVFPGGSKTCATLGLASMAPKASSSSQTP